MSLISYPLALDDFFSRLDIVSCRFSLRDSRRNSQTHGGILNTSVGAFPLWEGTVNLTNSRYGQMHHAKLAALISGGGSFEVHSMPLSYPRKDPRGEKLVGFTPTLSLRAANNHDILLTGLPPNYILSEDDFLGFTYLISGKVHRTLHQVYGTVQADASGSIQMPFSVAPPLPVGVVVGSPVTLAKPRIFAKVVPKTFNGGVHSSLFTRDSSFDIIQSLTGV